MRGKSRALLLDEINELKKRKLVEEKTIDRLQQESDAASKLVTYSLNDLLIGEMAAQEKKIDARLKIAGCYKTYYDTMFNHFL